MMAESYAISYAVMLIRPRFAHMASKHGCGVLEEEKPAPHLVVVGPRGRRVLPGNCLRKLFDEDLFATMDKMLLDAVAQVK